VPGAVVGTQVLFRSLHQHSPQKARDGVRCMRHAASRTLHQARQSSSSKECCVQSGYCAAQGLLRLQYCVAFILTVAVDSREKPSDFQCKPCLLSHHRLVLWEGGITYPTGSTTGGFACRLDFQRLAELLLGAILCG
jgi:hypothetical protein